MNLFDRDMVQMSFLYEEVAKRAFGRNSVNNPSVHHSVFSTFVRSVGTPDYGERLENLRGCLREITEKFCSDRRRSIADGEMASVFSAISEAASPYDFARIISILQSRFVKKPNRSPDTQSRKRRQ